MVLSGQHQCQWEKVEVGVFAGPDLSESGLVLALDAANSKGYDKYENLLQYSEDFSNGVWVKQNGFSITSNTATAPDGTLTADTASRVNLDLEYLYQNTNAPGTYTLSCWVRAVTGTTTFTMGSYNATDGSQTSPTFTATTTWQRFSHTVTVTTTNGWYPCVPSVSGATVYLWGAQLEKGSSVTDYYATTSTAKNRGTTWTDLSGRGNNGTLTNGPTYSSANGGSIVFDGTNDYVNMGNSQAGNFGTSNFSINAFFKFTSTGNNSGIFCKSIGDNPTTIYGWLLNIPDGTELGFAMATTNSGWGSSGSYSCKSTGISINDGNWRMVTIVGDRTQTNISMYINGTLQTLQEYAGGLNLFNTVGNVTNTYNLVLGNESDASHPFNGNIAQASIYNRALTAAEIQQNFNANRSRFGI